MGPRKPDEGYDTLPEVIRHRMTRREYAWLSDREKRELIEDHTQPDHDAEDPAP